MRPLPYASSARNDTGLYNAQLGVWLFLACVAMFFGGLFSAYAFLATGAETWPSASESRSIPVGAGCTGVLILSTVTVTRSWLAAASGNFAACRKSLGLTILLGVAFLTLLCSEVFWRIEQGMLPSTNNFFGISYVLMGTYALHVLGGVLAAACLLGRGQEAWRIDPLRFANRLEVTGLYWNFLVLLWFVLFVTLYLL